jgi:hypothetical protein
MSTRNDPPEPAEAEREPARPIEYGRWAQRADRRHGERDGRNRIPSLAEVIDILEAPGPARMPTPYLEMLFSRARDMMEHERLWYIAATASVRSRLVQLESQASAARAALGPAEELRVKARAELSEEDLLARHSAEELRTENFIRLRREAEREQRIASAESNYLRVLGQVHAIEVEMTRVRDSVQSRLSIARMRALRISAYLAARTATYWEGLVHTHRDGRHLAPLLPHLIPRLPLWVVPEEDESPLASPETQPLTGTRLTDPARSTVDQAPSPSSRGEQSSSAASPRADQSSAAAYPGSSAVPASQASSTMTGGADGQAPEDQPVPAYRR